MRNQQMAFINIREDTHKACKLHHKNKMEVGITRFSVIKPLQGIFDILIKQRISRLFF